MFNGIDLSFMQKKVVENPKVSIGAAAIGTIALIYAFARSGGNDIDQDNENTLPDYAHRDIDFEFTQRFAKKNQQRRRTGSNENSPNKLIRNNRSKIDKNKNKLSVKDNNEEQKDEDIDANKDKKYSPFDPMNPNYSYDMEDDENYEEEEQEEGFSTDAYYVPFRIKGAKTKRRPDDPFMAMFKMYASKEPSVDYEEYVNDENRENKTNENVIDNDDNDDMDENDEEKGDEKEEQNGDKDIGSSPPLNPVIPSVRQQNGLGGLDSLRERYYKKQLPPSFQSSALADAFQSESQQAIQNDLAELEDKTILGGIKQSVSMMTQSND